MITRKQIRFRLSLAVIGAFFLLLFGQYFIEIPESNRELVQTMITFLGGSFVTIIGFYFTDSNQDE